MCKKQFAIGLSGSCGISFPEQLEMLKRIGYHGFFVIWGPNLNIEELVQKAKQLDLRFQSLHAPWGYAGDMWHENEEKAALGVQELKTCVDACLQCGTDILVVHPFMGFDEHDPNALGLTRFAQVVDYAREKGVKIAFENTEGMEYLQALMEHFAGDDTVGFCWDTGHELCYNYSKNMLALYGEKLLCTHLNDNLGIKDPGGKITWLDDLHLLPFDGVADWQEFVKRLQRCNFTDILTFELNIKSKPGRHENDAYDAMPYEEFLAEAYKRACRIADLFTGE